MRFILIFTTFIYLYSCEVFYDKNISTYSLIKKYSKNNFSYTESITYLDTNKIFINNFQNYYLENYKKTNPKNEVLEMLKVYDFPRDLFNKVDISIFSNTDKTITLQSIISSYLGGAHGSYEVKLQNFYHKITINLKDIITNYNKLLQIAKQHYKFIHLMKQNQSLVDDGWFENKFILPKNFALTNRGILFYYNSYEIKPYSYGHTTFMLPYYKIDNLLKLHFNKKPIIFKNKYGKIIVNYDKDKIIFKIKNFYYTQNEKIYIKIYNYKTISKEYKDLEYDTYKTIIIKKPKKEIIIDIKVLFDKNKMPENQKVYRFSIL